MRVKNKSKQVFVLNLTKGVDYGPDYAPTKSEIRRTVTTEAGEAGVQVVEMEAPASVTWLSGESRDVPDTFAEIVDFKTAVASGVLTVLSSTAPAPAAPAAPKKHVKAT